MNKSESWGSKMDRFRKLIFNADDPQILSRLSKHKIDDAYLERGRVLFYEVEGLAFEKKGAYLDKGSQSTDWQDRLAKAKESLRDKQEFGKMLGFQYPTEVKAMGIYVEWPSRVPDWITYAKDIYQRVLNHPDYVAVCEDYGMPKAEIEAALAEIEALSDIRLNGVKQSATAQLSTEERNERMEVLMRYCAELTGWARYALKDKPQLLEKLGIRVR